MTANGFRKRGRRPTFEAEREAQGEGLEVKQIWVSFFLLLIFFVLVFKKLRWSMPYQQFVKYL